MTVSTRRGRNLALVDRRHNHSACIMEIITTHIDDAKARLLQQYKDSPGMCAMVESLFGSQIQDIENAAAQFYTRLDIDASVGRPAR